MSGDRGFITWNPRGETAERLDMIKAILAEYQDYLPLTMRQIFYRAVGQYGYEKDERAYKRLLYVGAKARRARMIDFDHVRDDGVTISDPGGYDSLEQLEATLKGEARRYTRQRQSGQGSRILTLCEAAGMVPQIANAVREFGVEVRSSGGYDSVTAKFQLAQSIVHLGAPVILLHLGDLDPSGEDMFTVIKEDVGAFVRRLDDTAEMVAVRVAATREQVSEMDLPTAPPKNTDSRAKNFVGETVQCEAIPPDALNRIVREAITSRLDSRIFDANLVQEEEERERIARVGQPVIHGCARLMLLARNPFATPTGRALAKARLRFRQIAAEAELAQASAVGCECVDAVRASAHARATPFENKSSNGAHSVVRNAVEFKTGVAIRQGIGGDARRVRRA